VIDTGTDRWHRLIAVGYRYMDSALQGSRDDQIDTRREVMKHMEFRTRTGRQNVHTFEAIEVRLKLLNSYP
jgi:hypothetical protein